MKIDYQIIFQLPRGKNCLKSQKIGKICFFTPISYKDGKAAF